MAEPRELRHIALGKLIYNKMKFKKKRTWEKYKNWKVLERILDTSTLTFLLKKLSSAH